MTDRTRALGALGALAGAAAILLAPLVAAASSAAYQATQLGQRPTYDPVFGRLLSFGTASDVYATLGSLWLPIVVVFVATCWGLRERIGPQLGPRGALGFRLLLGGLGLTAVGVVGDYVLGREVLGQWGYGAAFTLELIGLVAAMGGGALVGLAARRTGALPTTPATLLMLGFLGIPTLTLVPNWPAAPLLWAGAAWLSVGLWLTSPPPTDQPAPEPEPVGPSGPAA